MSRRAGVDTASLFPILPECAGPEPADDRETEEEVSGLGQATSLSGRAFHETDTASMVARIRERIRRRHYLNPRITEQIVDSVTRDIETGGGR